MTDGSQAWAAELAQIKRDLHALATAPRAPLTEQVIEAQNELAAQQAEILANQADLAAAQADITQAQADIVAAQNQLAETTQTLVFSPGANDDTANGTGWNDWVTLGSVDVPTWASSVAITVTIANALQLSAGPGLVMLARAQLGGNVVDPIVVIDPHSDSSSTGDVTEAVWGAATSSLPAAGSRNVVIQTNGSSSDRLRATTATVFIATCTFIE